MGLAWDSVTGTVWILDARDTGGSVPFTALHQYDVSGAVLTEVGTYDLSPFMLPTYGADDMTGLVVIGGDIWTAYRPDVLHVYQPDSYVMHFQVVPLPGAVLLGTIGLGFANYLLKRRSAS
jgi:hypothetical protein